MKKIRIAAIAAAVVLALGVTTAFAAGGRNFVDADGDGICDNRGTGRGCWYVDADGDGVCDNYGAGRWAVRCCPCRPSTGRWCISTTMKGTLPRRSETFWAGT